MLLAGASGNGKIVTMARAELEDPASYKGNSDAYRHAVSFEVDAQDHRFVFYPDGCERLERLIEHIDSAQECMQMFYFMFQDDDAGQRVLDALVAAAQRGVEVELMVDDFGTDAPASFFDPLLEAGGRFELFSPRLSVRYLIRNHQKMAIADRERVMAGGFNISDHYFADPPNNGWCDLGVYIEGPVTEKFCAWFDRLKEWIEDKSSDFRLIRHMVRDWDGGDGPVRLLVGGPGKSVGKWSVCTKYDMAQANRLDMVMAYFSPPRSFRQVMNRLAERGTARVIMAGKSDNATTIAAARSLYRRMLRSGVKVYEFQPCKLHMKLMIIGDVVYFGSANFDHRSIRLNLELMVRVEDAGLADRLRKMIDHMEEASEPITKDWLDTHATWYNRLRWKIGKFIVSGVDYTVTRRLNLKV